MAEIIRTQTSPSHGALAATFIAANLLLSPGIALEAGAVTQVLPRVQLAGSLRSNGERYDPFADMIFAPAEHTSLIGFYAILLAQQEELGSDFAQVLHDNAWDLYAR